MVLFRVSIYIYMYTHIFIDSGPLLFAAVEGRHVIGLQQPLRVQVVFGFFTCLLRVVHVLAGCCELVLPLGVPGPPKEPKTIAPYPKIESIGSIGSIILATLEVQVAG